MFNKLRNELKTRAEEKAVTIIINHFKNEKMKNWRTFAAGCAGAIWVALLPLINTGNFDIHKDWKNLVTAAGIALFGYLAKDAQVTGLPNNDQPK